ncbi:AraC family transcriptional regulator [Enterovibrio sp. ZSDZ35]|uniref:AraC family transcriptional regulator n=1 Tax=Enterovibrio qingdaonensis TaxID=2899818 RepID=A0ABT5QJH4_9GAMM|nr:AraC family transcriptional regulator [Enterovibrio sp. ZSDZ35]MDD1781137.1 AraC family transcriptional regulator [Enterovibrio sp. ZSDZ35]
MKKDLTAHFKKSTLLPWIEMRVAHQSCACYEPHSHDEFSFGIIQQGTATYQNRNASYHIAQGDIVTINPNDVHSCNPNAGTWSYSMLFVDAMQMGIIQEDVLGESRRDYVPFPNDVERDERIRRKYLHLFQSLEDESDVFDAEVALYEFVETVMAGGALKSIERRHDLPTLCWVKDKLLDNFQQTQQLEELANEAGMSRYQLLRAFKGQFGLPPNAYLMDEKIKRAKVMLRAGEGIADVALQLGFSDQAHFQRQFKKKLAVTPKYYQSHFVSK